MSRHFYYDEKLGRVVERGCPPQSSGSPPCVSDTLGFGGHQLADMEADRKANGFRGVEFTPDPQVPGFYQVKCDNRRVYERYVKHRGFVNATGTGGVMLSQDDLDRAAALAGRELGDG